jgi:ABC-type Na+ efflux pump permease subunit
MIWAIASKDVVDGLRSRTIWKYMIIVLLIMVTYRYLPLLGQGGVAEVVVYDKGDSRLVEALQNSSMHEVREVSSMPEFMAYMDDGDEGELGLVIPADYDQALQSDEPKLLEGHVLWSSRGSVDKLRTEYEAALSEIMGESVRIEVSEVIVPKSDSMGSTRMIALVPLLIVLIVGMMTVPNLMFEEKTTQTIDTLLVSPAKISHVIAGKAVAGAIYCLTTGAIALAFNWAFVVNWWLAIAALFASTLFGVGLGLTLGTYLDNAQQLSLWSIIAFQPILIPVVFFAIEPVFSQGIRNALPWIPNVTLVKLFHLSLTSPGNSGIHWGHLSVLAGSIVLLFAAVTWKVRRSER